MAAMSITINGILSSSSKSFSKNTSLPIRPKVSRVCFTSPASRSYSQGQLQSGRVYCSARDESKEQLGDLADKAYDLKEQAVDKAEEIADRTKANADKAGEIADATKEDLEKYAAEASESAKGAAETATETAKKTVEGAWDAAKDNTEKLKEAVAGKSKEVGDYIDDQVKK